MKSYQIVLADDHVMFRQGIKHILEDTTDLEVVGEVDDGLQLIECLKVVSTDMVILDISMPNLRGIEATREIKIMLPDVKVLILTMHKNKEYVYHAIASGAEGYLLKEDADTELFAAIDTIRQGGHYISPLLSGELAYEFIQAHHKGYAALQSDSLTIREREVLKLIAEGLPNKEIADVLCISVRTVEHHRTNIMKKLNMKHTANLVKYAIQEGYTSSHPA
ncbi:two component transcriptional regulator protein, LuxR family [Candidatus Vecturithrix granuli]|uniref:Two component transcriptional regulator protein, LuxR family n=1 Tax=Vecturithrix granuli TaxID=1499967 RepID=A0A081C9I6_VECG1|nr:two component transcriptional regulator protein, LuxR family [Candidatus Vecturithrix granuli]